MEISLGVTTFKLKTPKGLFTTGDMGLQLSYIIGNYKGGGVEKRKFYVWCRGQQLLIRL
jgi:hypothetical protein